MEYSTSVSFNARQLSIKGRSVAKFVEEANIQSPTQKPNKKRAKSRLKLCCQSHAALLTDWNRFHQIPVYCPIVTGIS